jgi:hypothetical protein
MEVYRLERDDLTLLSEKRIDKEKHLEERLIRAESAKIGDVEMLYVSRQRGIDEGGRFDILGVDEDGNMVIVELKRGAAKREVIAQALEYASKIREAEYGYIQQQYQDFRSAEQDSDIALDLNEAHAEHFDLDEPIGPEDFNADQRLVIIASDIQESEDLLRMADFLREHEIDVVPVEYSWYRDETEDIELLTTDAIRQPLDQLPAGPPGSESPEWKKRRKEFWEEFQALHKKSGFTGGTFNPEGAAYVIHAFTDTENDNPPYIRPAIRYNNEAYVEIRFYNKEFVQDEDNRSAFETAVAEAAKEIGLEGASSILDELEWDRKEGRGFDKIRLSYGHLDHADFTDEEQLEQVQHWFVDVTKVYKAALEEMEGTGRIEV